MLKKKQRERIQQNREIFGRRLRCTKCWVTMRDIEPYGLDGEFIHPRNACINAGKAFNWTPPRNAARRNEAHGIIHVIAKKDFRARRRGARQARKLRPKK